MAQHQDSTDPIRHTRLFELIRQTNLIDERARVSRQQSAAVMTDIQRFLIQANQSFGTIDDA